MSSTPRQSSSHRLAQDLQTQYPPPPYLARADPILPPRYDQWEAIPGIIAKESYLLGEFLQTPGWFHAIENKASSIDIIRKTIRPQNVDKHWSLRFLYYAPYLDDVDNGFVGEILCELIYTVFTPDPLRWLRGIETIMELTHWSRDTITRWFNSRRYVRNTRFDVPMDCQWQEIHCDNVRLKVPIRTSACRFLAHIQEHNGYTLSTETFYYCVTQQLVNLAMMFSQSRHFPSMSRIFANLAYKAVYVGPYDFWSNNPLEDLQEIEGYSKKYNASERPRNVIFPQFCNIPRNISSKYRAFPFPGQDHINAYVSHWMSDGPIKFIKEVPQKGSRRRPPVTDQVRVEIWIESFIPQHHADEFFPRISF